MTPLFRFVSNMYAHGFGRLRTLSAVAAFFALDDNYGRAAEACAIAGVYFDCLDGSLK